MKSGVYLSPCGNHIVGLEFDCYDGKSFIKLDFEALTIAGAGDNNLQNQLQVLLSYCHYLGEL